MAPRRSQLPMRSNGEALAEAGSARGGLCGRASSRAGSPPVAAGLSLMSVLMARLLWGSSSDEGRWGQPGKGALGRAYWIQQMTAQTAA